MDIRIIIQRIIEVDKDIESLEEKIEAMKVLKERLISMIEDRQIDKKDDR